MSLKAQRRSESERSVTTSASLLEQIVNNLPTGAFVRDYYPVRGWFAQGDLACFGDSAESEDWDDTASLINSSSPGAPMSPDSGAPKGTARDDGVAYADGRITMQMKQSERYACKKCGCEVTVTTAPSVSGKGGQGSLVCCGEKMSTQV